TRLARCTAEGVVWSWGPSKAGAGWTNHPGVRMWRGYEAALVRYGLNICAEWIGRGYKDTCADTISLMADLSFQARRLGRTSHGVSLTSLETPPWWGDEAFHTSHQSNLLRKDPEHYGQYFTVEPTLPYVWPR